MKKPCDCCEGLEATTPQPIYNRPGLDALAYRLGTHGSFLETMQARLTTLSLRLNEADQNKTFPNPISPLQALTTREANDPAIALLDAWAIVADVLTFYQERLANEGYLPTATERRSILELARLVGYRLRPGVAASVFLAFTMEKGYNGLVPAKTGVQSLPGPDELPQTFETDVDLPARAVWNGMKPRLRQLQMMRNTTSILYLEGMAANLKPNDPLLIISASESDPYFRRIHEFQIEATDNRTKLFLRGDLDFSKLNSKIDQKPLTGTKIKSVWPEDGAENITVFKDNLTLSWSGTEGGQTYSITLRAKDAPPPLPTPITGTSHSLSELGADLEVNTTYYWRVKATNDDDDACADDREEWQFTTAEPQTLVYVAPELNKSVDISSGTVTFQWRWLSPPPTTPLQYTLEIYSSSECEAGKLIGTSLLVAEKQPFEGILTVDYTDTEGTLKAGETYSWRVIATFADGSIEPIKSGCWSFATTDGSSASIQASSEPTPAELDTNWIKATGYIIATLTSMLTKLSTELEDSQQSISTLEAWVEIEADALEYPLNLFKKLDTIADSEVDYCLVKKWLETLQKELKGIDDQGTNGIKGQLRLRRGLVSRPGRAYPKQFIDLNVVSDIKNSSYLDDKPAIPSLPGLSEAFDPISPELDNLWDLLEDAAETEDNKIQAVEGLKKRLTLLTAIFRDVKKAGFTENFDFTDIEKWIDNPNNEKPGLIQRLGQISTGKQNSQALSRLIEPLTRKRTQQPANALQLKRTVKQIFEAGSDIEPRLMTTLHHQLKDTLYRTWAKAEAVSISDLQGVQALRIKAAPFGAKVPETPIYREIPDEENEGKTKIIVVGYEAQLITDFVDTTLVANNYLKHITLDVENKQIMHGGWVVIQWPKEQQPDDIQNPLIARVIDVETVAKPNYGQLTQLELDQDWLKTDGDIKTLRNAVIYAQSESLSLAEEPIEIDVQGQQIWLDGLYEALEAGRWLIISGERTDIPGTSGVQGSERVMLAGVKQDLQQVKVEGQNVPLQGNKMYTTLQLDKPLTYTYKRDTVTIYGNVVKASHGKTHKEILGSGNSSQEQQSFTLKHSPLTYLAASTPAGTESTLEVRVNDILWHEKVNLIDLGADERGYITRIDNENNSTITFGDGEHGVRLPTGVENVKALYRSGIGKEGNVSAEQISLLVAKPLGVKGVINPLAGTGGANRERKEQARRNVPLAIMALDRLVSVQDYEDFARTFAGISKASSIKLTDGRRELIHLTIAGLDDMPIIEDSDLYRGLCLALRKYGALQQPFRVEARELMLLVIVANLHLHPDYQWESVEPKVRAALLYAFSFENRQLGQDVLLSEVIGIIQQIPGVVYVDIDVLEGISKTEADNRDALSGRLKEIADVGPLATPQDRLLVEMASFKESKIKPAQLAYLSPEVPDTLILREVSG